ncbi:hypothetical protein AB0393_13040 [Streptomyces cyaneofuscatus]|uniref:Uncharacterized protein n=1 Tax=Streptomyces bacillaris TaxID=68179 RepID=A0ABW6E3M9_9ACTN|nr:MULTISPECIES: hypothetical protein [Streptomyces]ONI49500.1 hypothetical protein STIB_65900 [Streptomyces sp. IB2014 011-1]UZI28017.1 hypothetical protein OH133_07675 [Streptomyces sp. VB1]
MTLLRREYAEEIFDALAKDGVELHHLLLHADSDAIAKRIEGSMEFPGDGERSVKVRAFRRRKIEVYEHAYATWLDERAEVIDTTALTPDQVVEEALPPEPFVNSSAIAKMAGPAAVVADYSWPGTSTTVLRLRAPDGRQMILKSNTSRDSFRRELTALSAWAPALGASAPQLLDVDENAQLLLTTAVTGQPLQYLTLTGPQERRAYERAVTGALLTAREILYARG